MSDATLPPDRYRDHDNPPTMVLQRRPPPAEPVSFRELFSQHYATIRRACSGFPHPGVVIVAVNPDRPRAISHLCVAAHADAPRAAIVGRHSHADLILPTDPALSLRHLAVILGPAPDGPPSLRLIDLRTHLGFEDERGRQCRSVEVDGSLAVRCGQHVLFLLLTGAQVDWPEDADEAWARLPPREYAGLEDEPGDDPWAIRPGLAGSSDLADTMAARMRRGSAGESTMVLRRAGPVVARRHLLVPDEDPRGRLMITTNGERRELVLGDQALHRGVLLGRYSRCDGIDDALPFEHAVSRVHLMIVSIDDVPHAIDTASTNGTLVEGEARPLRMAPLDPSRALILAHGPSQVRWRPA